MFSRQSMNSSDPRVIEVFAHRYVPLRVQVIREAGQRAEGQRRFKCPRTKRGERVLPERISCLMNGYYLNPTRRTYTLPRKSCNIQVIRSHKQSVMTPYYCITYKEAFAPSQAQLSSDFFRKGKVQSRTGKNA